MAPDGLNKPPTPVRPMISLVPWPEIMSSVQRIVHTGSVGLWVPDNLTSADECVSIRCYPLSSFTYATLVMDEDDLQAFLQRSGRVQIASSHDEVVWLTFAPTAATRVDADHPSQTGTSLLSSGGRMDLTKLSSTPDSVPVLVFGQILHIELVVPSHAIDVMASNRTPTKWENIHPLGIGLN